MRQVILDFDESMSDYELSEVADHIEDTCDVPVKATVRIGGCGACSNVIDPKLFEDIESFAVLCDRAGNGRDARKVRSWIKKLSK